MRTVNLRTAAFLALLGVLHLLLPDLMWRWRARGALAAATRRAAQALGWGLVAVAALLAALALP